MPSASATAGILVLAPALLAGLVAGCTTTQQQAARLHLRSEREDAGRKPIEVKRPNPDVRVIESSIVRGSGGAAVAVTLRNTGADPLNDLPLAVGVRSPDGTVFLNDRGHLPYFQTHAPALAPGARTTWVFTSTKTLPAGVPVAKVGVPAPHPLTTASSVPELDVSHVTASHQNSDAKETSVEVEVTNHTGMPQYDVAVYAWARKGGRLVAAGRGSVEELASDSTATVKLELIGAPGDARVHVAAPPTIFQ